MEAGKAEVTLERRQSQGREGAAIDVTVWRLPLIATLLASAGVVALYFDTFRSLVSIWSRSDTYAHGFFILPISLYLVWESRDRLRGVYPSPDPRAVAPIVLMGLGWSVSRVSNVLVFEQYFGVAMLPVVAWAVLGSTVARRLAFPLGFLLLAVPVGEALIPHLIDFTAAFTVSGLRLTGVPVLQRGNFLTLPNGQWSVVEACSGLRYLIATVTVGLMFAYLSYRSWWRRAAFLGLSLVVPIVANGFRAYMIVMLGYLSDMRLAVGVDHLLYGWVFFGIVIFLLLWLGSRFRDAGHTVRESSGPTANGDRLPPSSGRFFGVGFGVVLASALAPLWVAHTGSRTPDSSPPGAFSPPARIGSWSSVEPAWRWKPRYVGAGLEASGAYEDAAGRVGVHVAFYRHQKQGAELVSSSNGLVPDDGAWRQLERRRKRVTIAGRDLDVVEALLEARNRSLRVWTWYWIDGRRTTSDTWAKILEAVSRLSGGTAPAAGVTVFTDAGPDEDASRERMRRFLDSALAPIEEELSTLVREGP